MRGYLISIAYCLLFIFTGVLLCIYVYTSWSSCLLNEGCGVEKSYGILWEASRGLLCKSVYQNILINPKIWWSGTRSNIFFLVVQHQTGDGRIAILRLNAFVLKQETLSGYYPVVDFIQLHIIQINLKYSGAQWSTIEVNKILFTLNHVNFMQPMLVSYSSCYFSFLEGDIAEVSKILSSGFHPVSPSRLV